MTSQPLSDKARLRLGRRYRAEKRFRLYGVLALFCGGLALSTLLWSVFSTGYSAFWRTEVLVDIHLSPANLGLKPPNT